MNFERQGAQHMTEFTILLSDSDTDLLFRIKEARGLDDLTGNEFAACLLEAELHRMKREILSN